MDSARPQHKDPFESWGDLDPESFGGTDFPPLATEEEIEVLNRFAKTIPIPDTSHPGNRFYYGEGLANGFNKDLPWIQTYSGRRFTPTDPNPNAIVIQDVVHALSNICRFTGHCKKFYSVAQHSVLVSYICDSQDALWGLLHDASEALATDLASPIKRLPELSGYREIEHKIQLAICKRFGLPIQEPGSVKKADLILLATEARDLLTIQRGDWDLNIEPLPFLIESWEPQKAKDMFMKRFFELTGCPDHYPHYLANKDRL